MLGHFRFRLTVPVKRILDAPCAGSREKIDLTVLI